MINTGKKKKRRKKQTKSSQRETRRENEQNNRVSKPSRANIQRSDATPPPQHTVNDDSSSSSCDTRDFQETVHNNEQDSFEAMVNSGSEIVNLARQSKLYKSSKQEEICTDTVMCIQRYLKNVFRQVS